MKFEDLGKAYADNEGMEEVIEDNEAPTMGNEDDNKEGYDDLKEAYANNESMEEVVEDNENPVEVESFEEVGKKKWASVFEKVSSFSSDLVENGKKAIYTATGVAFEAPGIVKETAKEVYGSAKESFTNAVDSAKQKVQEVKTNLVEKAQEAKKSFFEKITKTKDKYVDKATELTTRGAEWGIKTGERVAVKIVETHDKIAEAVQEIRIKALENRIKEGKMAEIRLEILNEERATREDVSSMSRSLENVNRLSA